jgi:N-methylhydantoinase A
MIRVGVDVGGTFTDIVLEQTAPGTSQKIFVHKVASTPSDQSVGVVQGIVEICGSAGVAPGDINMVLHGTTVATNMVIERKGAEVGMITTRGFRDILHMGRHKRPHNFSLQFDVPWQSKPLVKRRNRLVVDERLRPPTGEVEVPLALDQVEEAAATFKKRGLKAVVICFLFSFLNNKHEAKARDIVKRVMPEAFVSCSHEVVNVIREYERFASTAMNAYIGPTTALYLERLEGRLREHGVNAAVRIMQSNGGISTVENSSRRPIGLLLSGPAGGVIGGRWTGASCNTNNVITVDVGGTSADISVIQNGERPACYGKGGVEPAVTDAQVVLGRLDPEHFLGGDLRIDPSLAHKAVEENVATPLKLSVKDAALGILRVVNNNMALAINANSVAKGIDPRNFTLMGFGGAGPLHATSLAEIIGAKDTISPLHPGITAAMGLLMTELQYEYTRSVLVVAQKAGKEEFAQVNRILADLTAEARAQLLGDGVPEETHRFTAVAECRYVGQGFELRAAMPDGALGPDNVKAVVRSFYEVHKQVYGHAFEDQLVEIITLRVVGSSATDTLKLPELAKGGRVDPNAAKLYVRETVFDDGKAYATPRFDRAKLLADDTVSGPALIVQHNSTTLVPPGYVASVLSHGDMRVARLSA